jgi:hypothetical protein
MIAEILGVIRMEEGGVTLIAKLFYQLIDFNK